ncbi:pleckstrin homology domain-containing family A member 5-like isoform X23 [Denticeps clupeoides]|nr:pleckstrin homology domain-containing family A member 5-like isoform X23 [Denticeps clupeoides]
MRTYYFCTDTAKDMESWMKVMTDAALVHTEPIRRLDKLKTEHHGPQEMNNILNHRALTQPEIQNNERNHEAMRLEDRKQRALLEKPGGHRCVPQKDGDRYAPQRDGDKHALKIDNEHCGLAKDHKKYGLAKEVEKYGLVKDGEKYGLVKDGDKYGLVKEVEKYGLVKDGEKYGLVKDGEKYGLVKDGGKYGLVKDGDKYGLIKDGEKYGLVKDGEKYGLIKDGEKYGLVKDGEKYGLIKDGEKYGLVKDGEKYALVKEGDRHTLKKEGERHSHLTKEREKHAAQKDLERYGERYGFQKDGGTEQPLTKINSIKLQPAQAAAIAAAVSASRQMQAAQQRPPLLNGPGEPAGERSPVDAGVAGGQPPPLTQEPEKNLQRTGSTQQLEQWVRIQRTRGLDDETRSITSYQTLPRNMPSHRAQVAPRYPEGYRTLPRNSGVRPDSISSLSASVYDRALGPSAAEKRRSMRDDTMWQLYEWQQRQAHSRQHAYSTLPSPKQLGSIAERAAGQSIPTSPYHTYSPRRSYSTTPRSEVSSPVFRGDVTIDRRHRAHLAKCGYPPDRRSVPVQSITAQSLQGKTPEELTLLLIKLRRQQAELNSLREHTLAQLMQLNLDANKPKSEILSHHLQRNLMYVDGQMKESEPLIFMIHTMIENSAPRPQLYQQASPEDYRDGAHVYQTEEPDVDAKLSRLCEQDKVVRMQEDKLQQLHREKHTLETALLSASQEIEMSANNPTAVQTVIQQRDVLQSGLLSTCRELSRVNGELERSWREYDRLEAEVMAAKNNLLKQLEALGSPQTEPPSQKHIQIQKDLWRIQDVMEALNKNKPKRSSDPNFHSSKPLSNLHKSEEPVPVPPRPPLPHSYEGGDVPSAAPPLPPTGGSQGHVPRPLQHRTDDRKSGQRNGAQGGPDYRLYKSEPELTTVAEVDESNGEDKTEQAAEKEPSSSKGIPYPVGIVPPRTKSPVMPESSTIASYVTLRKSKKPDPRTQDRPRSAVDQSCLAEGGRTRMSVEEQMERIRRHQQGAALREKRRDQENSLSRSSSFSKDQIPSNPYYTLQTRKREEVVSPDRQELEASLRALEQEMKKRALAQQQATPPTEPQAAVTREEDAASPPPGVEHRNPDLEKQEEEEEGEEDERREEERKRLMCDNSLQTAVMVRVSPEEDDDDDAEEEEVKEAEQDQIISLSFKHSQLVTATTSDT